MYEDINLENKNNCISYRTGIKRIKIKDYSESIYTENNKKFRRVCIFILNDS